MRLLPGSFLLVLALRLSAQVVPLPNAHAHNDYRHDHPLQDALDNGFTSVEADIYDVGGVLYVYHAMPPDPDPDRTLRSLYLEPLARRLREKGSVYAGYTGPFYLMIDIKSEAHATYQQLARELEPYAWMLTCRDASRQKQVTVFLSGNRPMEEVLSGVAPCTALDGRPVDLGKGIPNTLMPVVSENFHKFSSWNGRGVMKERERVRLEGFIMAAHKEGKKVRLWAAPDTPIAWGYLLDMGVDLINTDKLAAFREFMSTEK